MLLLSGGYIKNIPQPHRRKYPDPEQKREVQVHITKYDLVGGVHYHVTFIEEPNPIWDPRAQGEASPHFEGTAYGEQIVGWRLAWDDDEGKGREKHSPSLDFKYQVEDFIRATVLEAFPPESHALFDRYGEPYEFEVESYGKPYEFEVEGMRGRYYYQREGD